MPSLKLVDMAGILVRLILLYYIVILHYPIGHGKPSDVEQKILSSKVTRLNISELYQHLNAESILQQMVDRQLILPANREDTIAYTHKYAQNSVAIKALFSTVTNPPMFLLSLCDVLETTGNSHQLKLATKLRLGMFPRFL